MKTNVSLIGMAGCGKSTAGVLLAKALNKDFVDTDLLIQRQQGRLLWEIIEAEGAAGFNRIEEGIITSLDVKNACIATGGSAVYSDTGMARLKSISTVVFIDVAFPEIKRRIADIKTRGIVIEKGRTLSGLYAERRPMYLKWADLVVDANGKNAEAVVAEIAEALRENPANYPHENGGVSIENR